MPANPKDKDKDDGRPITRMGTRKNGNLATPDELQDIKNAIEGRKFLEKHSLLCPPGELATHEALSICLHQVSALPGLQKQAINVIRAMAFLLEELKESAINETIRDAFDSQIMEFTSNMKILLEDVNEKISEHLKAAVVQAVQSAPSTPPANTGPMNKVPNPPITYASVLVSPPPYANPKLATREGIKARQFLIEGIRESTLQGHDTQRVKAELNNIVREMGLTEGRIRSVEFQHSGSTLIEVDSDSAAKWFADIDNRIDLCSRLGDDVSFHTRTYSTIVFNMPLTLDPQDRMHIEEIQEVNNLKSNAILAVRWAKPVE